MPLKKIRGRGGGEKRKGIVIGGMVIGLLLGCNNGIAEQLEKKSSFYESVMKIGQGFQEIFGIFGKAMGDDFGIVKSEDKRSQVGAHFEKVKQGLGNTKEKLEGLMRDITSAPHADTTSVDSIIKGANAVLTKLIESVTKLAEVTKKDAANEIGKVNVSGANNGAPTNDVKIIIEEVKAILGTAKESGVEIGKGTDDGKVVDHASGNGATAALVGKNGAQAGATAGPLLAEQVSKADPLSMIDKIGNANTTGGVLTQDNNNEVLKLATAVAGGGVNNVGSKTTADLAAGVALKAMTNGGTFSAQSSNKEAEAVKSAAANAVNKVLGILDEIIRRTVLSELYKVGKAVNGMQYSENTAEKSEGATKK